MIHDRTGLFILNPDVRNLNIRTKIAVILILETDSAKQIIQISAVIMSVGGRARKRWRSLDEDLWSTFRATSKLNESVEKYTAKKNIRWMTNEDYPQN